MVALTNLSEVVDGADTIHRASEWINGDVAIVVWRTGNRLLTQGIQDAHPNLHQMTEIWLVQDEKAERVVLNCSHM